MCLESVSGFSHLTTAPANNPSPLVSIIVDENFILKNKKLRRNWLHRKRNWLSALGRMRLMMLMIKCDLLLQFYELNFLNNSL
jgi:hypothetical protein